MRLAGYGLEDACRTTTTPNERPILERVDGRNGRDGDTGFETQARTHFRKAKEASSGISWLIGLARGGTAPTPEERDKTNVMQQVERLEAYLLKLGTLAKLINANP
jgi:hypothetical protein